MKVAAIDVGTNAVLLSVVDAGAGGVRPLDERCEITRLGEGLDRRGTILPEAAERTLAVLADYAAAVRAHGVVAPRLRAVGPQALREAASARPTGRAEGARDFIARAAALLGTPHEV
ncbi:MAG: hypothetical protein AABZ30_03175, partial [Myxococcota bacterium]